MKRKNNTNTNRSNNVNTSSPLSSSSSKGKNFWDLNDFTCIKSNVDKGLLVKNATNILSFTLNKSVLSEYAENFNQFKTSNTNSDSSSSSSDSNNTGIKINLNNRKNKNLYENREKPENIQKLFHLFLQLVHRCSIVSSEIKDREKRKKQQHQHNSNNNNNNYASANDLDVNDINMSMATTGYNSVSLNDGCDDDDDSDNDSDDSDNEDKSNTTTEKHTNVKMSKYMELFLEPIQSIVNSNSSSNGSDPVIKYNGYTFWLFIFHDQFNPNKLMENLMKEAMHYNTLKKNGYHADVKIYGHSTWRDIEDLNMLSKLSDI